MIVNKVQWKTYLSWQQRHHAVSKEINIFKCSFFQLSVENEPGLFWLHFSSLYDWSRKLAPLSIVVKTKPNRVLVIRIFPRALSGLLVFTLSSHWLFRVSSFLLIGRMINLIFFLTTLNRKTLYMVRHIDIKPAPLCGTEECWQTFCRCIDCQICTIWSISSCDKSVPAGA